MVFDEELLAKLQRLAMIEIEEEKKEQIAKNLSDVTAFMDNLKHVDTDGIEIHHTQSTPLRQDVIKKEGSLAQEVLKHAPQAQDGYFIVPKIIE
ncbi:Asp-tRNA(Asn)/Glu-tRNA(Gln) amidotransferase subunit GatC [Helicobacter mustelae]|uniref:Aspartyl/glutamyl-tRNA(Asn/Gln) amidotransferase subunit C n=1 Tax=Helicobacter mustelae (strain ATCC 43772 / CCUG 25715 / CIP 103759 / LMG 18044 / NCTC 12198 / R85-136P) TaxID=679897 RepID=D3UHL2_HELM1|nr:Asp-tRNA(Asn)/Glu-tRNA(Gln) amidotransferase subunit GatC [Helicobacter mustelae]CBG39984.1 putative Glu-tRNAGln amidotransferase subunit C [Helicobacter mustelae 12198]SQH71498.1 Glu-tRNAGln amidotransferase subunit C [Helicobacter mustelae]STP12624.1 Glu-tRNAGln amidotransferase subunit C [Helicobacter mustelae]